MTENTNSNIGKTIGKYKIVSLLGRGGMAEVYKAYQQSLDRHVALKLMHNFLAEDPDFFERFAREARNVAGLRHPNIIQIHDFDREGPNSYMVMEYIDGGTLKERLEALAKAGQRMPIPEALKVITEVGSALAYAHKRNMIHRDIKPANVMIDSNGRSILTDFGIAKVVSAGKFTASGSILGTPAYMSPEQGLGQPGDARSDIYSLGVMLYQLVTGRLPFDADTPVAVILKHVNENLPPPRALNPAIPQSLENVIIKALAKDPAQRYQTVDDMIAHLNNPALAESMELPIESTIRRPNLDPTQATLVGLDRTMPPVNRVQPKEQDTHIDTPGKTPPPAPSRLPIILGGLAALAIVAVVLVVGAAVILPRLNPASPTAVVVVTQGQAPTQVSASVTNEAHPTGTAAGTPTTDAIVAALTQQAAISAAQEATLKALQATATPSPTPDLTETAAACTPDVALAGQQPKDNGFIIINRQTTVTLTLTNKGTCAWDAKSTFNYVSGDQVQLDSSTNAAVPETAAGANATVTIVLKPTAAKNLSSTWQLKLGDGRAVGQPIVLNYRAVVPATLAPTQPPLPTITPTNAVPQGGPITGANATFFKCDYIPNTTDYTCLTSIGVGGGVPPYVITIDGLADADHTGVQTPDKPFFFQVRGRRCITSPHGFSVVDAAGQRFNGQFQVDINAHLFGSNNNEVCGLG